MIRRVVVSKGVIDEWLLVKKVGCVPGSEQFLAMGRHIASLHDLSEYMAGQLTARMLPNGDVQVDTPYEPARFPVQRVKPAQGVDFGEGPATWPGCTRALPKAMCIIESPPAPAPACDCGFWAFCSFVLGVIVTEFVWILSNNWEAVTSWVQ